MTARERDTRWSATLDCDEYFRTLVETTPECVKIVAPDGTLLHMNSAGLRMVGAASAEAAIGMNVYDLIAPEDRDRFREFNERICRGERGVIDFDIIGLQGTRRHVESHATPLRHLDGTTVHLAITHDVSERGQADRAMFLLGAIVDSSDDAIVSKNLNGVITSWNKGAERLFGYTAEEAVGQPITMVIPHERLDEEPQILSRLKRGERVDHFETVRRRKDGELLDISLTISPVKDARGTIIGASKIARDITDRKRAEAAIQRLLKEQERIEAELRRANADLEQFAFSASHDLQEPLRNIQLYGELLSRHSGAPLEGQALEFLGELRQNATRMATMMQGLLDYASLTGMDSCEVPVDANAALATTLANLAGVISESGAQVTRDALPWVRIHEVHLQQLFQNLIGNAIKYRSAERTPAVHISAEQQNGYWLFSVSDNGMGIAPEFIEKIFVLFKRLHARNEYSGTGLGLAICQRIVERCGGRISVDSEPGRGSTFRFTLPE